MASRDLTATSGAPRGSLPAIALPPSVNCDLCGWNMPFPGVRDSDGNLPGLLTCSLCVEDALATRTLLEEHHV